MMDWIQLKLTLLRLLLSQQPGTKSVPHNHYCWLIEMLSVEGKWNQRPYATLSSFLQRFDRLQQHKWHFFWVSLHSISHVFLQDRSDMQKHANLHWTSTAMFSYQHNCTWLGIALYKHSHKYCKLSWLGYTFTILFCPTQTCLEAFHIGKSLSLWNLTSCL